MSVDSLHPVDTKEVIEVNKPFKPILDKETGEALLKGVEMSEEQVLITTELFHDWYFIQWYKSENKEYVEWNFMKSTKLLNWSSETANFCSIYCFGILCLTEKTFYKFKNLKRVLLPPTITAIPFCCFYGCASLEEIICPTVTCIGDYAFCGCQNLKWIKFEKIEGIGKHAFESCENLKDFEKLANKCFIDEYAFKDCKNIILQPREGSRLMENFAYGLKPSNFHFNPRNIWITLLVINEELYDIIYMHPYHHTYYPMNAFGKNDRDKFPKEVTVKNRILGLVNEREPIDPIQNMFENDGWAGENQQEEWNKKANLLEESALNGRDAFLETRKALFGV